MQKGAILPCESMRKYLQQLHLAVAAPFYGNIAAHGNKQLKLSLLLITNNCKPANEEEFRFLQLYIPCSHAWILAYAYIEKTRTTPYGLKREL